MENGIQMTLEMFMPGMFHEQTVGASERLVKISALPDTELEWKETEALSLEKFLESSKNSQKKIDPNGLYTRMYLECSQAIRDGIISQYSLKWTRGGYDAEWQVFNSKYHGVPQNRERVYTIGHLRRYGPTKILPITGTDGEDCYEIKQIGEYGGGRKNPNHYRVYDPDGIAPTLNTMAGGGREPHIAEAIPSKFGIDYNEGGAGATDKQLSNHEIRCRSIEAQTRRNSGCSYHTDCFDVKYIGLGRIGMSTEEAPTICARDYKDPLRVTVPICVGNTNPSGRGQNGNCYYTGGVMPAVCCNKNDGQRIAIPVLTPDRAEKRQNGRRMKENNDPAFTLTAQDRHGVAVKVKEATQKGYAEAHPGDSINLTMPDSKTRRGRVGGAMRTDIRHELQSRDRGSDRGDGP